MYKQGGFVFPVKMLLRFIPALILFFALVSGQIGGIARAESPAPDKSDWVAIKSAITAQIDAFKRDDGEAAFSFAAPGIRERFGKAEVFLDMVKSAYPAVYRPASVAFLETSIIAGSPLQTVQVSDGAGTVWLALYRMQRQKDGSWKINGCSLSLAKAVSS